MRKMNIDLQELRRLAEKAKIPENQYYMPKDVYEMYGNIPDILIELLDRLESAEKVCRAAEIVEEALLLIEEISECENDYDFNECKLGVAQELAKIALNYLCKALAEWRGE